MTGLIEDVFERHVAGWDPFRIERLWRTVYASGYNQHPDFTVIGVLSGIEIACWDIVGKALEQPIYNLLGGKVHERLRSYTYLYPEPVAGGRSSGRATAVQMDPVAAPGRAAAYAEQGFTAVKLDRCTTCRCSTRTSFPCTSWTTRSWWCATCAKRSAAAATC